MESGHFNSTLLLMLLVLVYSSPLANPLSFDMSSFELNPSTAKLDLSGDATVSASGSALQLNGAAGNSSGGAFYHKALHLWKFKNGTTNTASFSSVFCFEISSTTADSSIGDGAISFIMLPHASVSSGTTGEENQMVAVEFDLGLDPISDRFGIDVSSTRPGTYVNVNGVGGFVSKGIAQVHVDYDSKAKNLSATLGFSGSLDSYHVSYLVDLSAVLPKKVHVGFTASTGTSGYVQIYRVLSWSFTSSLQKVEEEEETKPGLSKPGKGAVAAGTGSVVLAIVCIVCWLIKKLWSRPCQIDINNSNCCFGSYCSNNIC